MRIVVINMKNSQKEKQMTNAEFERCPVGIKNSADIKHLSETFDFKLDAMVQRVEEKIDLMNDKIQLEFNQMNEKIDMVDEKVSDLDKNIKVLDQKLEGVDNLDSFIEKKIENSTKDKVFNFVKWIITGVLGSGVITLFATIIVKLIK